MSIESLYRMHFVYWGKGHIRMLFNELGLFLFYLMMLGSVGDHVGMFFADIGVIGCL